MEKMSLDKPYIVSARRYRPATFGSVVGQKTLTATLKNAIDSGRLAQAYLFCGPRGVGKTSCARIFAKTINCLHPTSEGEACGECESCRAIDAGNSFNLVELDAASNNSVDDIRLISEQVHVPPQGGKYRVFIIDEVHMLSNAAFNAFLKTLEEPPGYVVFILATTEKHKVIPTILSRCQIYDFKRITVADMVEHLEYVAREEGIETDRDALGIIALKADGAMRDALSIFDQVAASSRGKVTRGNTVESLNVLDHEVYFRLVDSFRRGDAGEGLLIYKEVRDKGFDSLIMVNGLASHIRNLMVAADPRTAGLLETSREMEERYARQASTLPVQWYYAALKLLNDCDLNYRMASSKRLLVELSLIRLSQLLKPATPPFDKLDQPWPLADPSKEPNAAVPAVAGDAVRVSDAPATVSSESGMPGLVAAVPASGHSVAGGGEEGRVVPLNRSGGRPRAFRLSVVSDNASGEEAAVGRNDAVSMERFSEAWGVFISQHPSLRILTNSMRSVRPEQTGEHEFRVVVDHPAQQQAYESAMRQLVGFLREYLGNDSVTLRVDVADVSGLPRKLPPKEFLKKVVSENDAMADFLRSLDAELV